MAKDYRSILGAPNMLGVMQNTVTGVPKLLPDPFYRVTDRKVGNTASYIKTTGERGAAKLTTHGAPARKYTPQGMSQTGVTMIHSFEQLSLDPLTLQNVMNPMNEQVQEIAIQEIDRQTKNHKARFETLRTQAIVSALVKGHIWFDGNGKILNSSSGAAIDIDYSVPAGNQNQIGGIIGASWATASTDIVGDLIAIRDLAVQSGKPPLRYAFYGANIPTYIGANSAAQQYIRGNPMLSMAAYESEIPDGFQGFKWVPLHAAYNVDTSTSWLPTGDELILTPEPTTDWYKLAEGSMLVPNSVDMAGFDALSAMRNVQTVFGMFSYAKLDHNPVSINQYLGDTFLPIIAVGDAIYQLDVVP